MRNKIHLLAVRFLLFIVDKRLIKAKAHRDLLADKIFGLYNLQQRLLKKLTELWSRIHLRGGSQ